MDLADFMGGPLSTPSKADSVKSDTSTSSSSGSGFFGKKGKEKAVEEVDPEEDEVRDTPVSPLLSCTLRSCADGCVNRFVRCRSAPGSARSASSTSASCRSTASRRRTCT